MKPPMKKMKYNSKSSNLETTFPTLIEISEQELEIEIASDMKILVPSITTVVDCVNADLTYVWEISSDNGRIIIAPKHVAPHEIKNFDQKLKSKLPNGQDGIHSKSVMDEELDFGYDNIDSLDSFFPAAKAVASESEEPELLTSEDIFLDYSKIHMKRKEKVLWNREAKSVLDLLAKDVTSGLKNVKESYLEKTNRPVSYLARIVTVISLQANDTLNIEGLTVSEILALAEKNFPISSKVKRVKRLELSRRLGLQNAVMKAHLSGILDFDSDLGRFRLSCAVMENNPVLSKKAIRVLNSLKAFSQPQHAKVSAELTNLEKTIFTLYKHDVLQEGVYLASITKSMKKLFPGVEMKMISKEFAVAELDGLVELVGRSNYKLNEILHRELHEHFKSVEELEKQSVPVVMVERGRNEETVNENGTNVSLDKLNVSELVANMVASS